jgi:hypothetical protein
VIAEGLRERKPYARPRSGKSIENLIGQPILLLCDFHLWWHGTQISKEDHVFLLSLELAPPHPYPPPSHPHCANVSNMATCLSVLCVEDRGFAFSR